MPFFDRQIPPCTVVASGPFTGIFRSWGVPTVLMKTDAIGGSRSRWTPPSSKTQPRH